jgi:aryl-alcohol dehydrogenase-like predicted oxidoreductase
LVLLQKEPATAPIVGTKMSHIKDAVAALSIKLTPEEIALLEEPCAASGDWLDIVNCGAKTA